MNKKIIISLISIICICVAIGTVQHFANNKPQENESLLRTDSYAATDNTALNSDSIKKSDETQQQAITVTVSINCTAALECGADVPSSGYFLSAVSYTADEGATAFDVLSALAAEHNITLIYQNKSYIQSIGGLAEKDCGAGSGWIYRINGNQPNKSASKYVLSDGDTVEWYYVTNKD